MVETEFYGGGFEDDNDEDHTEPRLIQIADHEDISPKDQGEEEPLTARNVDGFWDTDRVRRVLSQETAKRIGVKITTAI